MSTPETPSLTDQAMEALANAVAKVVDEHRRQGRPLAVWHEGKAVWVAAPELGALQEAAVPWRPSGVEPRP